jgi:DNA-directed RNA polymerase subunit K/omega
MDESNELIEQGEGAALPSEPPPPITSRFLYVDIAALRAKQLRRGARPRLSDGEGSHRPHKAERVAMEEVKQGLVYYDVPGQKPGRTESGASGA